LGGTVIISPGTKALQLSDDFMGSQLREQKEFLNIVRNLCVFWPFSGEIRVAFNYRLSAFFDRSSSLPASYRMV
jgi:hypothetical protein